MGFFDLYFSFLYHCGLNKEYINEIDNIIEIIIQSLKCKDQSLNFSSAFLLFQNLFLYSLKYKQLNNLEELKRILNIYKETMNIITTQLENDDSILLFDFISLVCIHFKYLMDNKSKEQLEERKLYEIIKDIFISIDIPLLAVRTMKSTLSIQHILDLTESSRNNPTGLFDSARYEERATPTNIHELISTIEQCQKDFYM